MAMTLRAARVNKGLTQLEACKLLGIGESTLINWEASRSFPNVPQIMKIEEVYGIPYNEIIFLPDNNG